MSLLKSMVVRGSVVLANAANKMQSLQMRLTADEVKDDLEHFEPYGFTSTPHAEAEGIVAFVGGDRSHGIVLVVADRRYRIKEMKPGEVAIYTDEGDKVHFKRGRVIEIETVTLKVKATEGVDFDTPIIRATGRIESAGDQVAGGISQIEHVHSEVQRGDGQSGMPVGGA